ncbi:hypothetical protein ACOJQI_20630 [Bacillus salacetis]|uniref:Agd3-related carbohydrate deacetylase n=1 Tax=Bacillus salacetis TaxID=2315464 RepID=UPI003BA22344
MTAKKIFSILLIFTLIFAFFVSVPESSIAKKSPEKASSTKDGWSSLQHKITDDSPAGIKSLKKSIKENAQTANFAGTENTLAAAGNAVKNPRKMEILLIAATEEEPSYSAAVDSLKRIGIPYKTLIASKEELTPQLLVPDGSSTGNFQGVLLTTGNLGYQSSPGVWESAFTYEEWQTLWNYEAQYGVRQAVLYTYPGSYPDNYGLISSNGASSDLEAVLTKEGAETFSYLNPDIKIGIKGAWTYQAAHEEGVTPLLKSTEGYTLAVLKNYPDGRESIALTMDHNPDQMHTMLLNYGIINWLTDGLFVGQRKTYLSIQPDDIMIPDDLWDPVKLSDETGLEYRMTGNDFNTITNWQRQFSSHPLFNGFMIEWPFNGEGAAAGDSLTEAIIANQGEFRWINHTWNHMLLEETTYEETVRQIVKNNRLATNYNFTNYSRKALITPEVSGLNNPAAMKAAYDKGVRYVVSDPSRGSSEQSRLPNTGIPNAHQPGILMIPRYATNIYYNASTPEEQTSEYNYRYKSYWGRDLSYSEIIDLESDQYLRYMIRYDINPLMFHQSNARAYDNTHSLLSDVLDRTQQKYSELVNLPVINLSQEEIGRKMQERMNLNDASVTAIYYPGDKITITSNLKVSVPLTGVNLSGAESYGGQSIYWATVPANRTKVFPLNQ